MHLIEYEGEETDQLYTLTHQTQGNGMADAPRSTGDIQKKLGRTIRQWFEPIIRMWRFTKSNGITEGFHRKMKLIQCRAYGYRNFQNYRLRVLIECGHVTL